MNAGTFLSIIPADINY